jgi:hypothetical protein
MSRPTIRIRRTREVREREDRFKMVRLANLLAEKWDSPKLHWTYNFAHPVAFWTAQFQTEGHEVFIKLDMALCESTDENTPHQWRLTLLGDRKPYCGDRWEVLDPLVGHPAVQRLVEALGQKEDEVGALIQSMLAELEAMAA